MRMRRKPNLARRIERCAHFLIAEPERLQGRWLNEFCFEELYVELGCGKGLFMAETAQKEQNVLFVGLEKLTNVIIIALERAEQNKLQNTRFINGLADDLTLYFAKGEVSRIYINFCDPWPANRHAKRRLTGKRFLELYSQVLCCGGEIHFKTDDLPLFEFSLEEFEQCGFLLSEVSRDLHENGIVGEMTDYEMKFHEHGKPICRCVASLGKLKQEK